MPANSDTNSNNNFNQSFDSEYGTIQNFIKGLNQNYLQSNNIEFLSLIESNDSFISSEESFVQGIDFYNEIDDIYTSSLNQTFSRLSQENRFIDLFHNTVLTDANNLSNISSTIESAVLDKKNNITNNSFSKKIISYFNENTLLNDFSLITKSYLEKFDNMTHQNIMSGLDSSIDFFTDLNSDNEGFEDVSSLLSQEFVHNRSRRSSVLKESLLVDYGNLEIRTDEVSFTKLKKETTADTVIQSMINFSRSIYAMSHKSYLKNIDLSYDFQHRYLDYSQENLDLINIIPDFYSYNTSSNVFDFINTKNSSFEYNQYFRKNNIVPFNANSYNITNELVLTNSFNEENFLPYYIPSNILNTFVSNLMIENSKYTMSYPQNKINSTQRGIGGLSEGTQTREVEGQQVGASNVYPAWYANYGFKILNEFNKCFTGSFFDVNFSNACSKVNDLYVWMFYFNALYKNSNSLEDIRNTASPYNLSSGAAGNSGSDPSMLFYNQGVMDDFTAGQHFSNVFNNIQQNENLENPESLRPGFVFNYFNFKNQGKIYFQNKPIVKYNGLQTSSNREFSQDNQSNFNELIYKQRIDYLIKKIKLKKLKNLNIDKKIFDEIIENIKKSNNKSIVLSYCENDEKNISAVNKNNEVFNLLFTESSDVLGDNNYYSHIDLLGDMSINNKSFLGYDKFRLLQRRVNGDEKRIKENLLNFINNYYDNSIFFSSTTFFDFVLNSIINDQTYSVNDLGNIVQTNNSYDYIDVLNCQALYFNYITSEEASSSVIELIVKRFIEKAIQLDSVSSNLIKNSLNNKFYAYDNESISLDDYDDESEESLIQYQKDILQTSDDLKFIKNSIYSLENIESLSNKSDYKFVSNIRTVDYSNTSGNTQNNISNSNRQARIDEAFTQLTQENYSSWLSSQKFGVAANIASNFYPGHILFYPFRSYSDFSKDGKVIYEKTLYNKIKEKPNTNGEKFYIEKESKFNISKEKNIKIKLNAYMCVSDEKRFNDHTRNLVSVIIEDIFDYTSSNEKTIFNKIIKTIQLYLRAVLIEYEEKEFNTYEEIRNFVNNNKIIFSDVSDIISCFGELFMPTFYRHQRQSALKVFSVLPVENLQEADLPYICEGKNLNSYVFGKFAKHNNLNNAIKRFYNKSKKSSIDLNTRNNIVKINADIIRARQNFLQNKDNIENINLHNTGEHIGLSMSHLFSAGNQNLQDIWFTPYTIKIENVYKSLYKSDLIQALNLDLILGYLKTQDRIINGSVNDVVTSSLFNEIKEKVSEDFSRKIEENFYKDVYMNMILKKSKSAESTSNYTLNIINSNIFTTQEEDLVENYRNINIFNNNSNFSQSKTSSIVNMTSFDNGRDYAFNNAGNSQGKLLNSSILSLGLSTNIIKNKSSNFITKVVINVIDLENLNKVYVPKIYLFSSSLSSNTGIFNSNYDENSLVFYDKNFNFKNLKDRVVNFNVEDQYLSTSFQNNEIETLLLDSNIYLSDVISNINNYYNDVFQNTVIDGSTSITPSQKFAYLNNHILNSHIFTKYIEKSARIITDYNVPELGKNMYDRKYINIINQIENNHFIKEFGISKSEFLNNVSLRDNTEVFSVNNFQKENLKANKFLQNIQNLTLISLMNDSEEYYDIYHIGINPECMNYFLLNEELKTNDDILVDIANIDRVLVDTFMHEKFSLLSESVSGNNKYYKSNKKAKNYKIIINTEVL